MLAETFSPRPRETGVLTVSRDFYILFFGNTAQEGKYMTQATDEKLPFYRNWHELIKPEKLEVDKSKHSETYGKFICQPLERGFASTIGNSLRRILLSSIQGAAITTVKIEGALHEFTSMKDVMEDVSEIILNIKQIRIKLNTLESLKVHIEKTGPGKVVAGDITGSSAVEIMNPDQIICTVTGDTTFQAELTVEWGKGYQPAEKQEKENLAVGQIPIDAIFTPVKKIQYVVSQARVGHQTDYDKLTLEVETDGSVRPENALAYAAKILKDQLTIFINFDEDKAEPDVNVIAGPPVPLNPYLDKPVEDLELSVRSANCLKNAEINFIGDLAQKTDQEMLKTKNFGRKSLNEIKALLAEMDLTLGMKFENWSPPPVREKKEDQGQ
ncbi:DNA-directed RNA polymerase subunit alpha [Desulfoprunum benzoelyticum]|uniref:DNA-directed RNA polymerase subunit alpha n=2 Tax=Desulfoprunum benzoelyticum TaxID=1506996 RepID=A0A840V3L8_9BACT|nr:DNA-directed RNA polymerase subunit alpha [Desulfoprunum benzoelyticum]MBB5348339.1 DNA-directed RNA polymerase subunit alpha [Desulfoprunum benzoelyticum]